MKLSEQLYVKQIKNSFDQNNKVQWMEFKVSSRTFKLRQALRGSIKVNSILSACRSQRVIEILKAFPPLVDLSRAI